MIEPVTFTLSSVPPSVNSIYGINYRERRVYLKPEVVAWQTKAAREVPLIELDNQNQIIRCDMVFYYQWRTKEGKLRNWDAANCHKPLIDMVAKKLGWKYPGDACVKFGSWGSVDSPDERTLVTLTVVQM